MAEAEKKKNKTLLIVIIVLAVLIIAGLTTVIVLLLNKEDKPIQNNNNNGLINYQPGVIGVDVDNFQAEFDQAVKDMQNSSIGIVFNNYAVSSDGINFKCYLGNAEGNGKDIYFNIYKDSSFSEQILLTGLIPPGSGIDTFKSEIDLEPGQYEAVLVLTKVDDDHSTILSQTNVQITLHVEG